MLKRSVGYLAVLALLAVSARAQINPRIYVKPSELSAILKRPMIVSVVEENEKEIKRLTRKEEKKPGGLKKYKEEIRIINENIKSGLEKYWKLNTSIEYRSESEVKELIKDAKKAKDSKYVILSFGYLHDSDDDVFARADVTVPALFYFRAEQTERKPDYKIYINNGNVREDITECKE